MSTNRSDNPFAPPTANTRAPAVAAGGDVFARDRYLLKQKLFAISESYRLYGEDGEDLLYVKRPAHIVRNLLSAGVAAVGVIVSIVAGVGIAAVSHPVVGVVIGAPLVVGSVVLGVRLSPLRNTLFCRDAALTDPVLTVSQDNRWQIPTAVYTLRDEQGAVVARFRKNFLWNLLRRRWYIDAPDGSLLLLVKEDSVIKAIIRRVAPNIIAAFMRTNFVFLTPDGETILGVFNRKLAIRDHYVLDLSQDHDHQINRRIAVAMGVMLDTGERR